MRILGDILALPDITEVESHRLSELCRILHALEGLFIEDREQVRVSVSACLHTVLIRNAAFLCRRVCSRMAQVFLSL
jgi:hypothetical protein